MSVNAGSVVVAIQAVDEASGVFGKIQASLGLLGNTLQGLGGGFQQIGSVISGFAAGGPMGAAVAGIGEVVQGLQFSVDAAAKAQTAWTDLQSTLHLTGPAWDEMKIKIDAFVESLRTTTTFSDTQLVGAFQRLSTYGMTAAQSMDALKAAVELAAAKHIDLETAATALGKAFQGNSMLLRRYGIEVATVIQETSLGTEAIKEMGVNLETATGAPLAAFTTAMTAAGLAVTDAQGKLLSHAAVLKEIETAWKGGAIDANQLSVIVGALGINFQGNKALAMDYAAVLGQVNTQFGGAAQAQASTYAGLQERLGNAVQVLGEKIGTGLLPALSGLLEGLIPVVDKFSSGVVAIQNWMAEVAKIPEVKAATDALGGAFSGLQKAFGDAWVSVSKDLMPALQELWGTLKDLWDALKPVFDAFGELLAAFGGSGADINPFKILLEALVVGIKGLAELIRLIIPVVKAFAWGFKEAADIITPVVKFIGEVVFGFIKDLTDVFQAFYDWLVGHSLWQDLWNGLLAATQTFAGMIGTFLGGMFTAWNTIFSGGMELLKTTLVTGFDIAFSTVQTIVQGAAGVLNTLIGTVQSLIQGTTNDWKDLVNAVTNTLPTIRAKISDFWGWALPFWKDQVNQLVTDFLARLDQMNAKLSGSCSVIQNTWTSTLNAMVSTTQSAFQQMVNDIQSQVNSIIATLEAAKAKVSTHSIWPDMLNEMVDQTKSAMADIHKEFAAGLTGPSGVIPTLQANPLPVPAAATTSAATAAPPASSQVFMVPVNVYLDGQLIQTFIEKRVVESLLTKAVRG